MTVLTGWPPLNRIIVGIDSTWKRAAVCGFSSMSSLTMRRSWRSEAISSRTGATTRQGPHQGAQKSTSTGPSASSTSASKLVSVICVRVPAMGVSLVAYPSLYKMKEGPPAILHSMIPLASASGYAVISIAVAFTAVLLWLLLRMEARDEAADRAKQDAAREAEAKRISPP